MVNEGKKLVQVVLELVSESPEEIQNLKRAVIEQSETINGQQQISQELNQ